MAPGFRPFFDFVETTEMRFRQFSIRHVLLVLTIVAVAFGWLQWRARQSEEQKHVVDVLLSDFLDSNVDVFFEHKFDPTASSPTKSMLGTRDRGAIGRILFGENAFFRVARLDLHAYPKGFDRWIEYALPKPDWYFERGLSAEKIKLLGELPDLTDLQCGGAMCLDDDDLLAISESPSLESLSLWGWNCYTDAGLRHIGGIISLEEVTIQSPYVTNLGIDELCRLPRLRKLDITDAVVTDEVAGRIAKCETLEELSFWRCPVSDAIFADLRGLKGLTHIHLSCSRCTMEGAAKAMQDARDDGGQLTVEVIEPRSSAGAGKR